MTIKHLFTCLCLFVMSSNAIAQEGVTATKLQTVLEGLTIATEQELMENNTPIDTNKILFYNSNGVVISTEQANQLIASGTSYPDIYLNEDKKLALIVIRPATDEEKKMLEQSRSQDMAMSTDLMGTAAKDFTLTDLNGTTYNLQDLKGRVVVLNFWFINCAPCVKEIPELNGIVEEFKDTDVVFLAPAQDSASSLNSFLEKTPYHYQIIPTARRLAFDYNINVFPTHIVIDKEGIIDFITFGYGQDTIDLLRNSITKALN